MNSRRYVVPDSDPREHLPRWTFRVSQFGQDERDRFSKLDAEVRARGCTSLCMSIDVDGSVSCGTAETIAGSYGQSKHNLRLSVDGYLFDGMRKVERLAR